MTDTSMFPALFNRALTSWPWYLTRASGIVAAILLFLLILGGIGQVTGHIFRFMEPIVAWVTHRRLGLALVAAVLLHMLALLFDSYEKFNLTSLFVPFISHYKPLYVGLGILAFYALIIVTLTSIFWNRSHPTMWKFTHYASYLVLGLVVVHALFSGTDLASGLLRLIWIGAGGIALWAIIIRLRRRGSLSQLD